MKINSNKLAEMIRESIEKHLLKLNEDSPYLPAGAEYAYNAPWNDGGNRKDDSVERVFQTTPFVLNIVAASVTDEDDVLRMVNKAMEKLPKEILVSAEFVYDEEWEQDEDGNGCPNRVDEDIESVDIYFKNGNKYVSFMKLIQDVYGTSNTELVSILNDAYESTIDIFMHDVSTAYEFDKMLDDYEHFEYISHIK